MTAPVPASAPAPVPRSALPGPRRLTLVGLFVFALTCVALLATPQADAAGPGPSQGPKGQVCTSHDLAVRLSDPGPADQTLHGELCRPGGERPSTVQLLVHGSTYNHQYWDFPVGDGAYSYVDAAVDAGYATFNIDLIGTGDSSHPPGEAVTPPAPAVALHDAITALRSGDVGGQPFKNVIWVGHSLGSLNAWYEIPTYRDVDAAILTGTLNYFNVEVPPFTHPAVEDPKFLDSGLDEFYVTTVPGTRGSTFYHPDTTDPAVVIADEKLKDVSPLPPGPLPEAPYDLRVPTLLLVGAEDLLYCQGAMEFDCDEPDTVLAYESRFYSPETPLTVETVPDTGHSVALSTTAPDAAEAMLDWAESQVAP